MRRIVPILMALLVLAACAGKQSPSYIVQVSLGPWQSADYSASQIIARLDTVASIIPVKNVIIGWTAQPEIYKEVGAYLHGKGIGMYLWLPVFAETEEVCDNTPAVDLWGREPANYDLAAGEGFRFNCPSNPANRANVVAVYDRLFADCGFDGAFLDRVRTQVLRGRGERRRGSRGRQPPREGPANRPGPVCAVYGTVCGTGLHDFIGPCRFYQAHALPLHVCACGDGVRV